MKILKRIIALASVAVLSMTMFSSCNKNEVITIEKKPVTEKIQRHTGIVCWGSSIGYSQYRCSFTKVIEDHMMSDECYIPVVNMSVPKDSTKTILARAGITKILVSKEFTVPKGLDPVEIQFKAEDNSYIFPLRYGIYCDGGMSNVTIGNVEGTLSITKDSAQRAKPKYYFTRKKEGKEVVINKGEQIISDSMTMYSDYIPVICMGEAGTWNDANDLIKQQQALIDSCKDKDKFVIVGMFNVPLEDADNMDEDEKYKLQKKENEKMDAALAKHWGDHYINIREYLCSEESIKYIESKDIEFDKDDKKKIKDKMIPESLKYDDENLLDVAYQLIGDAVYDKLVELDYLYHKTPGDLKK